MAEQNVTRRLAAILAADMVGYSRLMGADEAGTIARLKAHRAELIDPNIAEHNGRIVKTTGDGLLAEFGSAVDALLCAVEVQRAMVEREANVPEDRRIIFRAGINVGEIVIDGDDILGDGVNVAARLEALAEPGGIRISDAVFKNVRGKLDLGFADLGPQKVKNIAEPVPTFRVLLDPVDVGKVVAAKRMRLVTWRWAAAGAVAAIVIAIAGVALWPRSSPQKSGKPSIAVLAFANLSGNPKEDHLGPGIAGDVFTDIAKSAGLLIVPWEVSRRVDPRDNPVDVGHRLNVTYVLTGDIRRTTNGLRARVRLVDTRKNQSIWADRYDRNPKQIIELPAEIAKGVMAALKLKLTSSERKLVGKRTTTNPEAYDLVLRARAENEKINPKANAEAIALLHQAITRDPNYAQAYTELARQYFWKWNFESARDRSILERGIPLAKKAIAIDPSLADGYRSLGFVQLWSKKYDEALRSYARAIELDPNNPYTRVQLGYAYLITGKPSMGLRYMKEARRLTTNEPWYYGMWIGLCLLYLDRQEEALRELKASLARNPRAFPAYYILGIIYFELGRMDEARAAVKESLRLNPRLSISNLKRFVPYKNLSDVERQLSALRKLGFPE